MPRSKAASTSANRRSTRCWRELQAKARAIAARAWPTGRPASRSRVLGRLRDQAGVQEAVVVSASGRVLASSSEDVSRLVPELPSQQALRQARSARGYTAIDAAAGKPLALRVVVPVASLSLADEARFLQLRQTVPEQFGSSAEAVEAAYRDYRELALSRQGLKRIYIVTLTLALSMALLVGDRACRAARQPAVRAARQPRPGDAGGGARRLQPPGAGDQPRRAGRADRIVQLDDAPAGRGAARGGREPHGAGERQGAPGEHPGQPFGGRAGVRPRPRACRSPTTARGRSWATSSMPSPRSMREQFRAHGALGLAAGDRTQGHRQDAAGARHGACSRIRRAATCSCSTTSRS